MSDATAVGTLMDFRAIDFGMADAVDEYTENRALLVEGYLDLRHANTLLRERHFLLLGRKGAGKSTVFQHMRASASTHQECVSVVQLGSFPFSDFSAIDSGGSTDVSRYPTTWRIILLLNLIKSIRDNALGHSLGSNFEKGLQRLHAAGLLSTPDLRGLVLRVGKRGFSSKGGPFGATWEISEQTRERGVAGLADSLFEMVAGVSSGGMTHFVCIDGLDDIVFRNQDRLYVLAALIEAALDLNLRLKEHDQKMKFLVACRRDVFNDLPSANMNKITQDRGVTLNWYQDLQHPMRSHLLQLVDRKAQVTYPDLEHVFTPSSPGSCRSGARKSTPCVTC